MSRRGIVKGAIGLFALLVPFWWASGELRYEVDELTGASRQVIQFGPFTWHGAEQRTPAVTWAESAMVDPARRMWVFSASSGIPPFVGILGCRPPFRAVGCIWASALIDSRKVELLRDWQAQIATATDFAARRAIEEEWFEHHGVELGFER